MDPAISVYASRNRRYSRPGNSLPASPVPGNTDAQRYDNAVRKTLTVSKEEMQRQEVEWQRTHTAGKPWKRKSGQN